MGDRQFVQRKSIGNLLSKLSASHHNWIERKTTTHRVDFEIRAGRHRVDGSHRFHRHRWPRLRPRPIRCCKSWVSPGFSTIPQPRRRDSIPTSWSFSQRSACNNRDELYCNCTARVGCLAPETRHLKPNTYNLPVGAGRWVAVEAAIDRWWRREGSVAASWQRSRPIHGRLCTGHWSSQQSCILMGWWLVFVWLWFGWENFTSNNNNALRNFPQNQDPTNSQCRSHQTSFEKLGFRLEPQPSEVAY